MKYKRDVGKVEVGLNVKTVIFVQTQPDIISISVLLMGLIT
jgi:hypothetical protein